MFSSYSQTSSELSDKEVTKEPLKHKENFLQSCSNFRCWQEKFKKFFYGLSPAMLLIEDYQVKQERMNIEYCLFDMMLCVAC